MFDTYVAVVSSGCRICFAIATHMFSSVFTSVSDVCFKCFSYFGHMLQVFHLDVSKVDWDAPHVAMCPTCQNLLLQLLGHHACAWGAEGLSATQQRAGEAEEDGGRGAGGPRVRVGSRGER